MNRWRLILPLLAGLAWALGCSSDPDTPVGAEFLEDGLIRSRPGEVFEDTIYVSGDTTFAVNSTITNASLMRVGFLNGFESAMLIRFDLSTASGDVRAVTEARLTINADVQNEIQVRFYELAAPFSEDSALLSLELGDSIPDDQGNVDRTLVGSAFERFVLSKTIVQDWIRGDRPHYGIAIVANEPGLDPSVAADFVDYYTKEDIENRGSDLAVVFADIPEDETEEFEVSDDGTFVTDHITSPHRVVSRGSANRLLIPINLSSLREDLLLHNAELVLSIANADTTDDDPQPIQLMLYAPTDSEIGSPGILNGETVIPIGITNQTMQMTLPVRGIVQKFITDPTSNHGLVLRYLSESSGPERLELHGTGAPDGLRPFYRLKLSEPPEFPDR